MKAEEVKNTGKIHIQKYSRKEVLTYLQKEESVWKTFQKMEIEYQEELLEFCMGNKGLRVTYDPVFKEVMNPVLYPERLESFLSSILGEKVEIVEILPREGVQMTESGSFVVMDVLVRLQNGNYLNVEMQKIGYSFPLARVDCYGADIIMRQYNLLKQRKKKDFKFSDMSKVITVIIMEKSSGEFREDHIHDTHHRTSVFDTGIAAEGLREDYFLCLDTFCKFVHTKIKTKREAWLLFFGSTSIEDILEVCEAFPEFIPLYEQVFAFRQDAGRLMEMYSEALRIMDRNTERYMVEELQDELEKKKDELQRAEQELQQTEQEIEQTRDEIRQTKQEIEQTRDEIRQTKQELQKTKDEVQQAKDEMQQAKDEMQQAKDEAEKKDVQIQQMNEEIERLRQQLEEQR